MFKVVGTNTYLNELNKLPKTYIGSAEKFHKKLAENPFLGKQLTYPFLIEKRLYFLVR